MCGCVHPLLDTGCLTPVATPTGSGTVFPCTHYHIYSLLLERSASASRLRLFVRVCVRACVCACVRACDTFTVHSRLYCLYVLQANQHPMNSSGLMIEQAIAIRKHNPKTRVYVLGLYMRHLIPLILCKMPPIAPLRATCSPAHCTLRLQNTAAAHHANSKTSSAFVCTRSPATRTHPRMHKVTRPPSLVGRFVRCPASLQCVTTSLVFITAASYPLPLPPTLCRTRSGTLFRITTPRWAYRNLVKALPWITCVREKLEDPQYVPPRIFHSPNFRHTSAIAWVAGLCLLQGR